MSVRGWLDRVIGPYAILVLREATGRNEALPQIVPSRPAALPRSERIAFWSLIAGVGTSTTAALVAHRSGAGGTPALLVDLDRRAPSLALRAGIQAATVADALLRPGHERELLSRWGLTPFLPGAPGLQASLESELVAAAVDRASANGPAVLDLGDGVEGLDPVLVARCTRLVICVGTRVAQLQAAFCAVPLLVDLPIPVVMAVVGAGDEDARHIAQRLPWPLVAVVPHDEHLARDEFAAAAPTLQAVDRLIRSLS